MGSSPVESRQQDPDQIILVDHVGIEAPAGPVHKLHDRDIIVPLKDRREKMV